MGDRDDAATITQLRRQTRQPRTSRVNPGQQIPFGPFGEHKIGFAKHRFQGRKRGSGGRRFGRGQRNSSGDTIRHHNGLAECITDYRADHIGHRCIHEVQAQGSAVQIGAVSRLTETRSVPCIEIDKPVLLNLCLLDRVGGGRLST